jgi:hypothetical protein
MATWKDNPIMTWAGNKVTDHGRQPLQEATERLGNDRRMADGTLRRQFIGIKRTWTVNWENVPIVNTVTTGLKTADGNMSAKEIENFYYTNPGKFRMILRRGSAMNLTAPNPAESALPYEDANFYIVNVMLTDFSKEVHKRGSVDLWNMSATLEEV